jgi:lipoprotein-releasing system permease protein
VKIPYELWVGWRYTRAGRGRRRDRFISFIAASSMTGIALGVAALIIVLSVMNGFQKEVRDRMLSVLPHIELFAVSGERGAALSDWQNLTALAKKNPEVQAGAPYVAAQAMLVRDQVLRGVQVRGIDPAAEKSVSDVAGHMKSGSLDDLQSGSYGVVLGRALADSLGVGVGASVLMLAPQASVTPAGFTPRMRQFKVVGVFEVGHYEYDSSLAFINVDDAARLFRDTGIGGVRLRITDMQKAPQVSQQLTQMLPPNIGATDWTRNNRTWFAAVQTEKRMMFIILTLIVAVAAFNLLSSLVMAVNDKQSDIAILRTLGASPGEVARIFVVQGALIGVIGTLMGVAGGALIAFNIDIIVPAIEHVLHVQFLPKDIYLISEMPSDPEMSDIVSIGLTSLILSFLATLYPSWRASRLQPAEVLRHD